MANLIHGYAVTKFEKCNASIICRGVETFEASGQKQVPFRDSKSFEQKLQTFQGCREIGSFSPW